MTRRAFLLTIGCSALWPSVTGAQDTRTLRIYLARHGESAANAAKLIAGHLDAALTDKGRQQARALAEVLKGVRLDASYSSTLSRSRETAQLASGGRPVRALEGLQERNFGRFENGSNADPEYLRRQFIENDALDGGETLAMLFGRVQAVLAQIRREHPSGTILIVGHTATNRMILRTLMNLTLAQANAVAQDNDEVYSIELTDGQPPRLWKLIREKNLGDL